MAAEEAVVYDGTDIYGIAVHDNVVFVQTRMDTEEEIVTTEDKVVDGETITFTRKISATKQASQMIAEGAYLEDGYNLSGITVGKWPWTMRYQSGWTTLSEKPTSLPYADGHYPYGFEPGKPSPIYAALQSGEGVEGDQAAE